MSLKIQFYNKKFSRLEQLKWLSALHLEILTRDTENKDQPAYWDKRNLKDIEDALLALEQMTDEMYEVEKEKYIEFISEDTYVDLMLERDLLDKIRGNHV